MIIIALGVVLVNPEMRALNPGTHVQGGVASSTTAPAGVNVRERTRR
jgi:hypothetical protein